MYVLLPSNNGSETHKMVKIKILFFIIYLFLFDFLKEDIFKKMSVPSNTNTKFLVFSFLPPDLNILVCLTYLSAIFNQEQKSPFSPAMNLGIY